MIDSVTVSGGGRSATLGRKTRKAIDKALTGQTRSGWERLDDDERTAALGPGPAQSEQARRDPDALAYVPMVMGEFRDAPDLADLARSTMRKHHLTHLYELPIVYHWKAKGGSKGGRIVYGKCVKLSGLAQHYAEAPFQIWLAADGVSGAELTNYQLEALIFHELLHIGTDEDEEGNVTYVVKGHDLEIFLEEVRLYGAWELDIKAAKRTFEQLTIAGLETELTEAYGSDAT